MALTIYFHIGESKTGTSYIQNFLDVNRENLFVDYSCLYPNLLLENMNLGRFHNHAQWYSSLKYNEQKLTNAIERIIEFAENHSIQKIILSNEGWLLDNLGTGVLERSIPKRNDLKLKAICYLRRIDYWIESAWKQWGLKTNKSFNEYIVKPEFYNRYKHILIRLDKWSDFIGKDNLIVRPYEKQQLKNGLVSDFLHCVGIDYEPNQWHNTENINIANNAGFNRDVLEILNYCHGLFENEHDNQLFEMFSILLSDKFQKKPFESYSLMTPKQRIDVINNNLPYEQEIATKYMGRKDGKIFYDPLPDPEETSQIYEGLTLEKSIPIIIKMINANHRNIKRNNIKLNQLEQELKSIKALKNNQRSSNNQISGKYNNLFVKILNKLRGFLK